MPVTEAPEKKISSPEELLFKKNETLEEMKKYKFVIQICGGAGCVSSHCMKVKDALVAELDRRGISDQVKVNVTGCIGTCALGPVMIVNPDGVFYTNLTPHDIKQIVDSHLINSIMVEKKTFFDVNTKKYIPFLKDIEFFKKQEKVVLKNCGTIDYSSIDQYIAHDGYVAASKALIEMKPVEVVDTMIKSGLGGRGGGGFPTGLKWKAGLNAEGNQKYIICNADEGDPGAFMDRSVIEGDPHAIIEGMMIGGYAIGANRGFVYIRAEYPIAIDRLYEAIKQAHDYGLLGENIFNTGFNFDIDIRIGAGSFVCGEETALMASIEGKRGEPSQKPPFPFEKGLYGKPSIINNVETFGTVPQIIRNGAEWFSSIGSEASSGTKIFALAGDIVNTGLVEVPIGFSLGDMIYGIGGGIKNKKIFKAAQTGGPSGGCITRENLNVPLDFNNLKELGTIMGSGGLIIMDEDTCMVDVARFFMEFVQDESCGKCTPCRLGTKRMLEILERITQGKGQQGDIELLEELGNTIKQTAICGLGQTGPNPVLNAIKYFREEFEEHIHDKYCRAGVCSDMFLSPCQNACPAGIDVPGYIALITAGRLRDAYNLIRKDNPFPAICGRVCTHPCESKCRRSQVDDPIAICDLKRYAADYALENQAPYSDIVFPKRGKKIAVIGAGPSGLTCGYYLARLGYDVDVFEDQPVAGGVLAFGIPEYRLPKTVLAQEIKAIEQVGVNIHLSSPVQNDKAFNKLKEEYDAVYIATGSQYSRKIGIEGEDLNGVYHGLDFLKDVHIKKDVVVGKNVAVIGGGNTAVDAARVAVRMGAEKVTIVYRREIEDMPADPREVRDAMEEGIQIVTLTAPVAFKGNDGLQQMECIKMELGEFDKSGRRRPVVVEDSEYRFNCDMAIIAVSQYSDLPFIKKSEVELTKWGTFVTDKYSHMTNVEGVFAGGDIVRGPDTVIAAIADGKHVAQSIDIFLGGDGVLNTGEPIEVPQPAEEKTIVEHERFPMKYMDPEERVQNFEEVAIGFHQLNAIAESMRCLRCDRR